MARPTHDSAEAQKQKFEEFKKAYSTLKKLMADEAYIAAYVIAFSILEDRLRAMYVVYLRYVKKRDLQDKDKRTSLWEVVKTIDSTGYFDDRLKDDIKKKADQRNKFLHATMLNMEEFTDANVKEIIDLVKRVEKARYKQRKDWGNGKGVEEGSA